MPLGGHPPSSCRRIFSWPPRIVAQFATPHPPRSRPPPAPVMRPPRPRSTAAPVARRHATHHTRVMYDPVHVHRATIAALPKAAATSTAATTAERRTQPTAASRHEPSRQRKPRPRHHPTAPACPSQDHAQTLDLLSPAIQKTRTRGRSNPAANGQV